VEQVSWYEIQEFIKKLNARTGERFRLPTESEWEYACREGGRKVRFCNGKNIADPSEINFYGGAEYKEPYSVAGVYRVGTTPVASFAPNSLGLYDMSGNVDEWTCSSYNESYDGSEQECAVSASKYSLVHAPDRGMGEERCRLCRIVPCIRKTKSSPIPDAGRGYCRVPQSPLGRLAHPIHGYQCLQ